MGKAKELRDFSLEELEAKEIDCRKELFILNNEVGQERKKGHFIPLKRREIAQIKTIIREKEMINNREG